MFRIVSFNRKIDGLAAIAIANRAAHFSVAQAMADIRRITGSNVEITTRLTEGADPAFDHALVDDHIGRAFDNDSVCVICDRWVDTYRRKR